MGFFSDNEFRHAEIWPELRAASRCRSRHRDQLQQLGANPLTASDSQGYVVDEKGIDLALLKQIKEVERGRISEYAQRRGSSARFVPGGRVWDVAAEVAFPSATQNELTAADARTLIANGVKAVSEGANMPPRRRRCTCCRRPGWPSGPARPRTAGGVAVSALEMAQNAGRVAWSAERVEAELAGITWDIHAVSYATAERYGSAGDYVVGANIAGFERVADAMLAQGVI
ncbi:hypothetical protein [Streptomyces sp. H34-S4]|uniref:hypothetical protein n=1 Tax=Streptomyces sp. H34-S4 TaxID=2996463 RepID=UPI00226EB93C|nr:hypothetical protein [Streptomyces sp. H34-S4]MCY0939492.1 hypothetical protein [Streptomyces sp. H34-S4]